MQKTIVTHVSCLNDFNNSVNSFCLTIDTAVVRRIQELSATAKDKDVYSLTEFFRFGVWSQRYIDEEEVDESAIQSTIHQIEASPSNVECDMIEVTADDFHFYAIPKGAGDSDTVTTPMIPIAELETPDPYIELE